MEIRNFRWDDLPKIVECMNRYAEAHGRSGQVTLAQLERSWRAPYNHPETDVFVAQDSDGRIIGYTIADLMDDPAQAFGVYQVLPGHKDIGRALMAAASERFRAASLANSAPGTEIYMDWNIPQESTEGIALCEEQGFPQVRQFYNMRIALTSPVDPPALPEGFERQPFTPARLRAVFDAKAEIFMDHWGDQHDTFEEWQHDVNREGFDPSLWWIIYRGDHIAGMVLSQRISDVLGFIGIVGVRRDFRKQGLAQIMLRQCFAEYQARGYRYVDLGVDSDSPTNAVALYERVGMNIHNSVLYYRHVLRPASPAAAHLKDSTGDA